MDDSQTQFYTRTDEAWEAMLDACREAKTSIDMEQYIFLNDQIGNRFIELFIQKRREGVAIRLLCDTVGSYPFYNSTTPTELEKVGIQIRFFNIISPWRIHNFFSWYFRDHRKILVVDGTVAFTGGVGIREDMRFWRDTHVRVTGAIVQEIQNAFNDMWALAAQKNIFRRFKRIRKYTKGFNFVTNAPYPTKRHLYHRFIEAIRNSKKYIYLTTPYFVPDARFLRVLRLAAKRGVDVRVILPKTSDVILVNRAAHSYFHQLLSYGVRIYEYPGEFIHAKVAIVDDEWATVGSFNFDNLSFLYNHEANIVSTDHKFIAQLKEHFEIDLVRSEEVNIRDWVKRPILWKIREYFILPFRQFL